MHHKLIYTRKKAGDSQETLAQLIGCTRQSYSQKERNERDFKLSEAEKIAQHYKTTIDDLFEDITQIGL